MQFDGKDFSWYWEIIKIPTFVLLAWVVLGFIVANFSYEIYIMVFGSLASLILQLGVFGFIGWMAVKDFKGTLKQSAICGALTGAITGFIGGIIGVLTVLSVPEVVGQAIEQAVTVGAPAETVRQFVVIGSYIGIVVCH